MKKILIMEVEDSECILTYGNYRCYSKDIAVCNIAMSMDINPKIKMDDPDVLPCDNSGYYLAWSGDNKDTENLFMENLKVYFDNFYYVKDTGWDFSELENDTYIAYIIENKDALGVSEFFEENE